MQFDKCLSNHCAGIKIMYAGDFLILIMLYAKVYHITADVQMFAYVEI